MNQQAQARVARRNKSDGRLDDLLDIASEIFREQGYEATSISEIARRAHASKETFYRHFSTKEDLFKAVVFRRAHPMGDQLKIILSANKPVNQTLMAFGNALLQLILTREYADRIRIVFTESKRFPIVGTEFFQAGVMQTHGLLANYLEDRRQAGELKPLDASLAAEQFIEMISAHLFRKVLLGIVDRVSAEERERRTSSAVDLFMAGYGTGSSLQSPVPALQKHAHTAKLRRKQ